MNAYNLKSFCFYSHWDFFLDIPKTYILRFFAGFFGPQARGATRMSRGYQAHPKIHVIRVVF